MWLVTIIYWLQAFLCPVIILGLTGIFIGNRDLLYILTGIGAVTGIILAEYIRRRIGLDVFFARIYGPNSIDEKLKKKKKNCTRRL